MFPSLFFNVSKILIWCIYTYSDPVELGLLPPVIASGSSTDYGTLDIRPSQVSDLPKL